MESSPQYRLSHEQLNAILQNLLKISKRGTPLHPCQQRTRYANLLHWLTSAMTALKQSTLPPTEVADRQQQAVTTVLSELIELTRKECSEKSVLLQMVLEYLISTLNSYWTAFQNSTKEMNYEYEHHAVRLEKEYVAEIKRLQVENEELRRDKEHRWRNMFMLIKDNRIHRKKNKKLMKSVQYEMERGYVMGEQLIALQGENQKLKAKLSYLQDKNIHVQDYVEVNIRLTELEDRVRTYPKKSRKVLKNEMLKIEIGQIKNLNEKIKFIIRAIQETGEIIDEIYEEETNWKNFQYNISTQTTYSQEDRSTNTPSLRYAHAETATYNHEHIELSLCDTVQVKVKQTRPERKENLNRESKNVMFMSQSYGKLNLALKKQDNRSRHISKRAERKQIFSVCESLKITIFQGRISYISTYNTQIFNGIQLANDMEQKIRKQQQLKTELKIQNTRRTAEMNQVECQTEEVENIQNYHYGLNRSTCKTNNKLIVESRVLHSRSNTKYCQFQIVKELYYCFDPNRYKSAQSLSLKLTPRGQKGVYYIPPILQQIDSENEMTELKQNQKQIKKKEPHFEIKTSMRRVGKLQRRGSQKQQLKNMLDHKIEPVKLIVQESIEHLRTGQSEKGRNRQEQQQSIIIKSPSEMKTTKHGSQTQSEIISPQQMKEIRKQLKNKIFSNTTDSLNQPPLSKNIRNNSTVLSQQQLKKLQPSNNLRPTERRQNNHKRAVTQVNQLPLTAHINQQYKMSRMNHKPKQLHRISEEIEQLGEERKLEKLNAVKEKLTTLLPYLAGKQAQLPVKDIDFSKGIDKILRNIDLRRNQLLTNSYTFKSYLTSYFKCLYGKELYINFINFLFNSLNEGQQLLFCLSRLSNPLLPEGYLIDLFKTLVLVVSKCYLTGQSPTSQSLRPDLLRYMVSLYYEQQQVDKFTAKMKRLSCLSLAGWFNCLQHELRQKAIGSQLYHFLSNILTQVQSSVTFQFLQELNYFLQSEQPVSHRLIEARLSLQGNVSLHRLCLICLRLDWTGMLDIQDSIQTAYLSRIGIFNRSASLSKIQQHMHVLAQFKNLDRCLKYQLQLQQLYKQEPSRHLLMICELNAFQYNIRTDFPIPKQLKFINLAWEALQKKIIYKQYRDRFEGQTPLPRNHSLA